MWKIKPNQDPLKFMGYGVSFHSTGASQSGKIIATTQRNDDLFECVWPFCGVGSERVKTFKLASFQTFSLSLEIWIRGSYYMLNLTLIRT